MVYYHKISVEMNFMSDHFDERIGVIGGSGLYSIDQLKDIKELKINTPFGKPSDDLLLGKIEDFEVVFLARHGRHHSFLPTEVPYKANIWAMKSLGVKWLISASAVGSLKREIKPLDVVIPKLARVVGRSANDTLYRYGGGSYYQKFQKAGSGAVVGALFLTDSGKAIRFNWEASIQRESSSAITSIDVWHKDAWNLGYPKPTITINTGIVLFI